MNDCCVCGWDTRALPRVFSLFWIPLKILLYKSSHPKKYFPNFSPPQKNPGIENSRPNPSISPVTWNSEYPPPPLGWLSQVMNELTSNWQPRLFGTWYNLTVFHVPDDNFPSSESKLRSIKEVIKATRNT